MARRFARGGYDVALLGNDEDQLLTLAAQLEALGATVGHAVADITDGDEAAAAIRRFGEHTGRIDVPHFNPSAFREGPARADRPRAAEDVALGVGALLTVQAARPFMSAGGRVTATGSMAADEPWHRAASARRAEGGLRNLVRSLDATLADDDIRAVSVTVRGTLAKEDPSPRPGRRRDLGRGPSGRERVADRGAVLRLTAVGRSGSGAPRSRAGARRTPRAGWRGRGGPPRPSPCAPAARG